MSRRSSLPSPTALRRRLAHPTSRVLADRSVLDSLISVAGLVGRTVRNPAGDEVGRMADVVVRWDGSPYPPVTGLLVRVGRRHSFVDMAQVAELSSSGARLRSARLDLSDFRHRDGEVAVASDVLDHQLVDVDGVRVVRASDLYLAPVGGQMRLVGADVGLQTLVRRLGPARWRTRPTPDRVIDWAAIQPFSGQSRNVRLARPNQDLQRLRPAELADLLEELGRSQRQELLASLQTDVAADVLEEMQSADLGAVLRDTTTNHAAALVAEMEPDEAVEALRHLDDQERLDLLAAMPPANAAELTELLTHQQGTAGSVMTSHLVMATSTDTVAGIQLRLRSELEHRADVDAVLVVDEHGVLVDDLQLFELFTGEPHAPVGDLIGEPWPLTVHVSTPLGEVVERFIDARGSSIVVVDDDNRPVGRILADDLVDALTPRRGRFRFPRLLR
ncbi:MAG: proteinMgtE intracellular protein [Acidimicrobiia bacterium]|nr:proteinMgtE intracellular protein [Acidimicrobiia bacterium]